MIRIKYERIKRFPSKKNEVWLIRDFNSNKVLKENKTSLLKDEANMLEYFSHIGVNTPKVYEKGKEFIIMEYIGPLSLCDYTEKCENENIPINDKIIFSLADQLKLIYESPLFKQKKLILNDVNLRNFVLKGEEVYFIDLEDIAIGDYLRDVGGMMAYFLTYNPHFSHWKLKELRRIYNLLEFRYPIKAFDIESRLLDWLEILSRRRQINFIGIYSQIGYTWIKS